MMRASFVLAILVTLTLAACLSDDAVPPAPTTSPSTPPPLPMRSPTPPPSRVPASPTPIQDALTDSSPWQLVWMKGAVVPADVAVTMAYWKSSTTGGFDGLAGYLVCNSYFAHVIPVGGSAIKHNGSDRLVEGTTAGCATPLQPSEEHNRFADTYLKTLLDVDRYEVDGDTLRLGTPFDWVLVYRPTTTIETKDEHDAILTCSNLSDAHDNRNRRDQPPGLRCPRLDTPTPSNGERKRP